MAGKGTIFDEFLSGNFDFLGKFKDLLNSFLKSVGDGLLDNRLIGDFKLKDLNSFFGDLSSGNLGKSLETDLMKGIDQFKSLSSDSLLAIYNTATGFTNNILASYMDALMSQVFVSEDIFLWVVKELEAKGSDPNRDGVLRRACLEHDLVKTIEWLDKKNKATYTIFEPSNIYDGVTAGQEGSFQVARYIMKQIKSSRREYADVYYDELDVEATASREENLFKYDYFLHLIAKTIFVYSFSNLTLNDWSNIVQDFSIDPSAFGTNDIKFSGRLKISSYEIDVLAPIYKSGLIGVIEERFPKSFKTVYIAPRNDKIKYLYLYIHSMDKFGSIRRIVHPDLHLRLRGIIISTYLKALSNAGESLLTTGLGQFIREPSDYIEPLIENFTRAIDPYLFQPSRQIYIVTNDGVSLPDESGSSTKPTLRNVDKSYMIGDIDLRKFRVYAYEELVRDGVIDNEEFQTQIVDKIYRITRSGKYKRYDVYSTNKQNRIYGTNGQFTGRYTTETKNFYIFSAYESNSSDTVLSRETFKTLVSKYLLDLYGQEFISSLAEDYPDLGIWEFVGQHQTEIDSVTEPLTSDQIVGTEEVTALDANAAALETITTLLAAPISESGLTPEQVADNQIRLAEIQTAINQTVEVLIDSISSIGSPGSLTLGAASSYEGAIQQLEQQYASGAITNTVLINGILNLRSTISNLLIQAGLDVPVRLLRNVNKLLVVIATKTTIDTEVSDLLSSIIPDLRIVLSQNRAKSLDRSLPNKLQQIVDVLQFLDPIVPTQSEADQLAVLNESLNSQMRDLILMESTSSVTLKGQFEGQKALFLSRAQANMRAFIRLLVLPAGDAQKDATFILNQWDTASNDTTAALNNSIATLLGYITDAAKVTSIGSRKTTYTSVLTPALAAIRTTITSSTANINAWNTTTLNNLRSSVETLMMGVLNEQLCDLYDDALDLAIGWSGASLDAAKAMSQGIHNDIADRILAWSNTVKTELTDGTVLSVTSTSRLKTSLASTISAYTYTYFTTLDNSVANVQTKALLAILKTEIDVLINGISTSGQSYLENHKAAFTNYSDTAVQQIQENIWSIVFSALNKIDLLILKMKQAVRATVTNSDIADLVVRVESVQEQMKVLMGSLSGATATSNQAEELRDCIEALRTILNLNPDIYTDVVTAVVKTQVTISDSEVDAILNEVRALLANKSWTTENFTAEFADEITLARRAIEKEIERRKTGIVLADTRRGPSTGEENDEAWRTALQSVGDIDIDSPDAETILEKELGRDPSTTGHFVYSFS